MEITTDTIPAIAPTFRFQWEEAQQCHVILYPEGMVKLSGSAGEILKRVDGTSTIAAITNALEQRFPGNELADDVINFFEVAQKHGWITTQ